MIRTIINIDKEKCNGCCLCVNACHESAIAMVDGKAQLIRDDYCDGLGNCLPACPTGAITFVEREAAAYNEAAVQENMMKKQDEASGKSHSQHQQHDLPCGCPGSQARALKRESETQKAPAPSAAAQSMAESQLRQWPVQIKLVPVNAPYFDGANLLIAADCAAYAYADFHNEFIKNRITLIGCPKLDDVDYSEKLTAILANNNIKSVTVVRMEVPCCGGIQNAAITALKNSGKMIPWQVVTLSTTGEILEQ
ncbi:MAG TPA: 4Fe-4S binding protein [Anaerovoracaceae bacterium]|nr:4Fe-4S binding protein [Anaerovoracaceae bacterium]